MRYVLILFCCVFTFVKGQDSSKLKQEPKYQIIYKLPLTSWLDFTSPSINFGIETMHTKTFAMHYEVGYINNYLNPVYNSAYPRTFQGAKAIIAPKFYFKHKERSSLYISPAVFYKFYSEQIVDAEFSRFGGQFFQTYDYKRNVQMASFTPKFGFLNNRKGKSVGFDFSAGIGFRVQNISKDKSIPDDAVLNNQQFIFTLDKDFGTYVRPNIFVSLALVFIKKEKQEEKDFKGFN